MIKRFLLRMAITARQHRATLGVAAAWVVVNGVIFAAALRQPWQDAVLVACCVHRIEGSWGRLYASFTELVVFGAVASLVVEDATRRYRPEATGPNIKQGGIEIHKPAPGLIRAGGTELFKKADRCRLHLTPPSLPGLKSPEVASGG